MASMTSQTVVCKIRIIRFILSLTEGIKIPILFNLFYAMYRGTYNYGLAITQKKKSLLIIIEIFCSKIFLNQSLESRMKRFTFCLLFFSLHSVVWKPPVFKKWLMQPIPKKYIFVIIIGLIIWPQIMWVFDRDVLLLSLKKKKKKKKKSFTPSFTDRA